MSAYLQSKMASSKLHVNIATRYTHFQYEQIMENIKAKYIHGKIKETYPEDASRLNISIMTELIRKELL